MEQKFQRRFGGLWVKIKQETMSCEIQLSVFRQLRSRTTFRSSLKDRKLRGFSNKFNLKYFSLKNFNLRMCLRFCFQIILGMMMSASLLLIMYRKDLGISKIRIECFLWILWGISKEEFWNRERLYFKKEKKQNSFGFFMKEQFLCLKKMKKQTFTKMKKYFQAKKIDILKVVLQSRNLEYFIFRKKNKWKQNSLLVTLNDKRTFCILIS